MPVLPFDQPWGPGATGWFYNSNGGSGMFSVDGPKRWNPLTDDGDALRLATKLRIDLYHYAGAMNHGEPDYVQAVPCDGNPEGASVLENSNQDPYAATRRAITRAAAELGRAAA
jgi:hypothetical protein